MSSKNNHTLAFITVAAILIGAVGYAIYNKSIATNRDVSSAVIADNRAVSLPNSTDAVYVSKNNNDTNKAHSNSNVVGKVISVNTNAESKTFIKIKSLSDKAQYTLLTSLDPDVVDIDRGDIVSFSSSLEKSNNGAYYFINNVSDYNILDKNTEVETSIRAIAISDIEPSMEGREVVVNGTVSNLTTSRKGHSFFSLEDDGDSINGVLFNSENNQLEDRLELLNDYADTSKKLNVKGKVGVYKGDLQIIASKVYN